MTISKNIKRPEVTSLVFDFDSTIVQSGPWTPAHASGELTRLVPTK